MDVHLLCTGLKLWYLDSFLHNFCSHLSLSSFHLLVWPYLWSAHAHSSLHMQRSFTVPRCNAYIYTDVYCTILLLFTYTRFVCIINKRLKDYKFSSFTFHLFYHFYPSTNFVADVYFFSFLSFLFFSLLSDKVTVFGF